MEVDHLILLVRTVLLTVSPSGTIWHGTARFYGTERGTDAKSVCAAIVPNRAKSCRLIVPLDRAKSCCSTNSSIAVS
jgi:hypothetical protein